MPADIPRKTYDYPLRRSITASIVFHVVLFIALVIATFASPPPKPRKFMRLPSSLTVITEAGEEKEPKGVERDIKVENATPPKPTPVPTPIPEPPKPTMDENVLLKPKPTPKKLEKKEAEEVKKVKPTPKPTPKPTAKPTPEPTKAPTKAPTPEVKKPPKEQKKVKPTPVPTPPEQDLPEIPPKGKEDGGNPEDAQAGGESAMQTEENVSLPAAYVNDAIRRLRQNFHYPSYWNAQLQQPVSTVIRFTIKNDGGITDIEIKESSGNSARDARALQAVRDTAVLLPISDYTDRKKITASIRFTFGTGSEY